MRQEIPASSEPMAGTNQEALDVGTLDSRRRNLAIGLGVVPVVGLDASGDNSGVNDLDGREACAVTASQVAVCTGPQTVSWEAPRGTQHTKMT